MHDNAHALNRLLGRAAAVIAEYERIEEDIGSSFTSLRL